MKSLMLKNQSLFKTNGKNLTSINISMYEQSSITSMLKTREI